MIERTLFLALKEHLSSKEISLITGPRQAGKTTLMLLLKGYLEKRRKKTLFLNLDVEADKEFFRSQRNLISRIELEFGKQKGYVFIDEIQRKADAGIFLKGLYDLRLPYKFIVSGSGSLELKEKIHESLAGRKRVFELNTLSFREFLNYMTGGRYRDKLSDFLELEEAKGYDLFRQYLQYGGYPRVVLAAQLKEKKMIIDDIYRSYLERDMAYLLKVEKTEAFTSLVKLMADQASKLINYSEFSSTLGISLPTVKKYLWYAEKTFIIERVTPYFRNLRKEITKSPVAYFWDLGLRNYSLGFFEKVAANSELGFLFQNFIFRLFKEELCFNPIKIHFWRTKDKAEVDFILDRGKDIIPVEVKFKRLKKPEAGRSLRSFISRYQPRQAWVVNLSLNEQIKLNKTNIVFLPYYKLLSQAAGTVLSVVTH